MKQITMLLFFLSSLVCCSMALVISERDTNPSQIELRWHSQVGESYEIRQSTELGNNTDFSPLSSGQQATPPLNKWWIERAPNSTRFFKLGLTEDANDGVASLTMNSGFSDGSSDWGFGLNNAASASFSVSAGELELDIADGGTKPAHVLLFQLNIPLLEDQAYTLLFDARTTGAPLIRAKVESASNASIADTGLLTLSATMRTYRYAFTHTNTDMVDAKIKFFLGNQSSNNNENDNARIYLDNIRLVQGDRIVVRMDAHRMNERLHRGNNFMAAKAMEGRGAPEDYELLNKSGFSHCRIGYKMDEVTLAAPSYTLPEADLLALEDMVDWCLEEGLIAVVDPIHNWANSTNEELKFSATDEAFAKLGKIWEQVADHFADYSVTNVVFEVFNEPHSGHDVARIISTSLASIRASSGNENRIVIVPGDGFSTRQALIDAFNNDEVSPADPYLIGTFHYYDPFSFTKITNTDPGYNPVWGSPAELAQVATDFQAVASANSSWATRNFTEELPVYLGEFGVDNEADNHGNDRKKWLSWVRMQAEAQDISWAHWNMYQNLRSAKGMGAWSSGPSGTILNPQDRSFDADPLEALVGHYEFENGVHVGVSISNQHPGFKGTGYTDFPDDTGYDIFVRTEDFYIPADSMYAVRIHYSSTTDQSLRIVSLNDSGSTVQAIASQLFPATGSEDTWNTTSVNMLFEAGNAAELKIVATPGSGVNLDWLEITLP